NRSRSEDGPAFPRLVQFGQPRMWDGNALSRVDRAQGFAFQHLRTRSAGTLSAAAERAAKSWSNAVLSVADADCDMGRPQHFVDTRVGERISAPAAACIGFLRRYSGHSELASIFWRN